MENLKLLELPELIDLLAEQTSLYIKMVKTGTAKEEFENCKKKTKEIQLEIKMRKANDGERGYNFLQRE
jgi:hypothetical protein